LSPSAGSFTWASLAQPLWQAAEELQLVALSVGFGWFPDSFGESYRRCPCVRLSFERCWDSWVADGSLAEEIGEKRVALNNHDEIYKVLDYRAALLSALQAWQAFQDTLTEAVMRNGDVELGWDFERQLT
jgi:hypothetical protein